MTVRHPLPPADKPALESLETTLGSPLPDALRALYEAHDGESEAQGRAMRFMSVAEAVDAHGFFSQGAYSFEKAALFWTDDNSNYAGVFLAGVLSGRVFFLNHDEPDTAPRFRSIAAFLVALQATADVEADWFEMPTDYPRTDASHAAKDDDAAALDLLGGIETLTGEQAAQAAMCVLNLLSPASFSLARRFLYVDDMWVQEKACEVLGLWRCAAAVDELVRVAREGMHNGRAAAVLALKRIATPDAQRAVKELKASMGQGYEWLFR